MHPLKTVREGVCRRYGLCIGYCIQTNLLEKREIMIEAFERGKRPSERALESIEVDAGAILQ